MSACPKALRPVPDLAFEEMLRCPDVAMCRAKRDYFLDLEVRSPETRARWAATATRRLRDAPDLPTLGPDGDLRKHGSRTPRASLDESGCDEQGYLRALFMPHGGRAPSHHAGQEMPGPPGQSLTEGTCAGGGAQGEGLP